MYVMNKVLEERKDIERIMLHKVIRHSRNNVSIYNLERGYNNKLLGFSPYRLNKDTDKYQDCETGYKYSHLSSVIHRQNGKRKDLEDEIYKLVPYSSNHIHLLYNEWLKDYKKFKIFCDNKCLPVLSKIDYNKLIKLINQWKIESGKLHYKMSRNEKRKLKKLFDKNK